MIRRKEWLYPAAILVLLISLCSAQDGSPTKITLNDLREYNITDYRGGKHTFTAQIIEKIKKTDIIVQLNALSLDSDPDLVVYIDTKENPTSKSQPYCSSDSIGYDVCLINEKDIKEDQYFVVEVRCSNRCKYSLNLIYKERIEYEAEKGGQIDIIFKESEVREILLKIPQLSSKQQFTNMIILAEFKNMYSFDYDKQAQFDFFGNQGQDQPSSKEKAQLHSIWINDNIRAIPLSQIKKDLCFNCSYSLDLKGPKDAVIQFSAALYDNSRKIKLFEQFSNGVVEEGEIQYFTLDFDDLFSVERETLISGEGRNKKFIANFLFNLIPYNGDPDLYIHYAETKPAALENYNWSSKTTFRQDLILITSDELNEQGYNNNKKVHIAVHGKEISAFQLRVDVYSKDYSNTIELQHGQPITGMVGKKKVINYQLRLDGEQAREVDIILSALQGNPDLFVKAWKYGDGSEQEITLEEIDLFRSNISSTKNNPFIGWSINKQGVDTVKIKYDPKKCGNNSNSDDDSYVYFPYCIYTIAVFGNDAQNGYILKATSNEPTGIQAIRENASEYLILNQSDVRVFSFKPMSLDHDITQIRFQLYSSSGFAGISADRDYNRLKEGKPEKDFMTSYNHQVTYSNRTDLQPGQKLSDFTYYIQVKALERTNAQLKVEIIRRGQKKLEYVEIITGISTKLIIEPKSTGHIKFGYSYGMAQSVVAKSDSEIKMYVGENKIEAPSKEKNSYNADDFPESSRTIKRINVNSTLVVDDGFLYGTIENVKDQQITVVVYTQVDTVYIELNNSVEDNLIPEVKRTYYFNIYSNIVNDDFTRIYAYVMASGTVLEQKISGYFYINNKALALFRDNDPVKYFEITKEALQKECPHLFGEERWQDCQFKIEVQSPREEKITISIIDPDLPSYVQYYGPTLSQLPLHDETRKFIYYMYGQNSTELILTINSFSYDFQLLGKIVSYTKFQAMDASTGNNFPSLSDTKDKLSIYTDPNVVQQVRFTPQTFEGEGCDNGCFLLISVVLPKFSMIDDKNLIGNLMKLQISGDRVYDLYEGESFQGTAKKGEFVYYRIFVPKEKEDQKLIINLTPLDEGDPDLFLNKDSIKLPTREENDLNSQSIAGDFLTVNRWTFKNHQPISGYYIVGVYANSDSTFSLQYQVSKYNVFKIEKNQVMQVNLFKDQIQYFVFHKKELGAFTVVTNMVQGNSGDSYLFIKESRNEGGKANKDFLSNIADPNTADKTTKYESHKEYLRWEDGQCEDCTYVIGIKSVEKHLMFSISLNMDGSVAQIQNNKIHLMYLQKETTSKIRFFSQDDFNVYVTSYSGYCIKAVVRSGYGTQQSLVTKECSSNKQSASGFDSFSLFVKHPNKDDQIQTGLGYQNTFVIELTSQFGVEKALVQVVSGGESRLITTGIPLESEIDPSSEISFTYYSSHDFLQAVYINLSAEDGQEYGLGNTYLNMKFADKKDREVISNDNTRADKMISKQFLTERNQPYLVVVKYTGLKKYKFSILLKESNTNNIPILSGSVMDVLPINQVSNYEVHMQQGSVLLLQNFNCVSDQNIFIYRFPMDLIQQKDTAERVSRKATSNHEIQIVKNVALNNGTLYVQKRANKQTKEKISKSLISAEVFAANEPIIYDYYQIGDSGILAIHQTADKLEVNFAEIECVEPSRCTNISGLVVNTITYALHVSDTRESLQRQAYCGLYEQKDLHLEKNIKPIVHGKEALNTPKKNTFEIKKHLIAQEIDKLYVSVVATVSITSDTQAIKTFNFIYGTHIVDNIHPETIFESESGNNSNLMVIIAICVLSIAILLLVIIVIYRRYKSVDTKLKYEMNDIRNVAYSDLENDSTSVPKPKEYGTILPEKGQSEMIEMK